MLRKIRITLAVLFFAAVTLLFLDVTGAAHTWLGWTAKVQLLPALLALNFGVVAALLVLTLLVGRIYCSVVCPMGVMQDIISWLHGRKKKARMRFSYSREKRTLRYTVLALFCVALALGVGSFVALLAPYSSYGRIAANLFAPVYRYGNNQLAMIAEHFNSYAFYEVEVWVKLGATFAISVLTFIIIGVLAWRNGRTYCNTICPVGTILGLVSRFAIYRPRIDAAKCKHCSLCSRRCKAACIDYKNHTIDASRCVACMDCLDACKHGAISLRGERKEERGERNDSFRGENNSGPNDKSNEITTGQVDSARRSFLLAAATVATTAAVKAESKKVDGGLAVIEDKVKPQRTTPIVPPGAQSLRHFARHCTGCQLCVQSCPNNVLRPSTDLLTLMQPEMGYERGYCRPECTRCSEVCPAGAIHLITSEEKSSTRIGHAVWIKKNCIPLTDGVRCGNCARHCPAGAIQMVASDADDPDSPQIPVVNTERCIGCGACENLCPARPFSAIYVEGHEVHSEY